MTKRQYRIILALGLVAVAGVLYAALRPSEPVYQGKTLTAWLVEYDKSVSNPPRMSLLRRSEPPAAVAIREMGTNALPGLLRMLLTPADSKPIARLKVWASQQSLLRPYVSFPEDKRTSAVAGFEILGPAAEPAVPQLTALLNSGCSPLYVAAALGTIGQAAVAPLTQALTNQNGEVQAMAASALGYRSLDGTDALPALAHCLTNRNILLSETAASAIKRISQRRGWVAPGHYYTGDDSFFNQKANDPAYTAQFRARARSIVPLLVKALQDTNSIVGTFVADALKEIDPDTAATVKLP